MYHFYQMIKFQLIVCKIVTYVLFAFTHCNCAGSDDWQTDESEPQEKSPTGWQTT